jgi:hypothetical protein
MSPVDDGEIEEVPRIHHVGVLPDLHDVGVLPQWSETGDRRKSSAMSTGGKKGVEMRRSSLPPASKGAKRSGARRPNRGDRSRHLVDS